MYKIRKNN